MWECAWKLYIHTHINNSINICYSLHKCHTKLIVSPGACPFREEYAEAVFTSLSHLRATTIVRHHSSRRTARIRKITRAAACTGNLSAINTNRKTSRTKGGWHAARQFVLGESQIRQLGQNTKLGWKGTRQLVVVEPRLRQLFQDAKL